MMKPDIYYYNPTCELSVANGSENFMPNKILRKLEYDLDIIPAFFAKPEDITLVRKHPSREFLNFLDKAGIELSGLQPVNEGLTDPSFLKQPKGFLRPWGWSPSVHKLLQPLKASSSSEFLSSPVARWNPFHKELYSRKTSLDLLRSIISSSNYKWMISGNELPRICVSHEQIIDFQRTWEGKRIVVKSPWSSSGRGLQILKPGEYNRSNEQVISGILNQQGYVLTELWHKKILDLSFQFYSNGRGNIEFKGFCSFKTDKAGRYQGGFIEEVSAGEMPEVREFITTHLDDIRTVLIRALSESSYSSHYEGWLGVDALLFSSDSGKIKIQPCLEVNCRYTMGTLALALRKYLFNGSSGEFRIFFKDHHQQDNIGNFFNEMVKREPLSMESGKIKKGFLPVSPPDPESDFGAYALIQDRRLRDQTG